MSFHDKIFDEVLASEEGTYAIGILSDLIDNLYAQYSIYTDSDALVTTALEMQIDTVFDELGGVDEEDEDEDDIPSDYDSYDYEDE